MHKISLENNVNSKNDGTNQSIENSPVIEKIQNVLGIDFNAVITENNTYLSTALYLIYWYHRTKNNPEKHNNMLENIYAYFGTNHKESISKLINDLEIQQIAFDHIEGNVLVSPTVDICIVNEKSEILSIQRDYFPKGPALIGGFILDEDENNSLNIDTQVYSALRIAGKKIIGGEIIYGEDLEEYFVSDINKTIKISLSKNNLKGYKYKDKVTRMVEPADPRHMVDTHSFLMTIEGGINNDKLSWQKKDKIMDLDTQKGGFAFGHHRQIISELTKEKDSIVIAENSHHEWIRGIINNPLDGAANIKTRFENNNNNAETPCPELSPIVIKMIDDLYSDEINEICDGNSFALGQRYLVDNALKHSIIDANNSCPYRSTLYAIMGAVQFFDIISREKIGFYDHWKNNSYNEQNSQKQKYAYFFTHKYKNHLDQMLAKFPEEIIIPTYEHLGATDLMKVRGIPIRFVGLSNDFLYVDEFWQSPLEFFGHDGDHSLRMAYEDEKYCLDNNISREELIEKSTKFGNNLLEKIKISKQDNMREKELKKLKKIILFEIVHEDSKPFMRDAIINSIQTGEGADIHKENIIVDPKTGYFSREETVEAQGGISPLAFLLHKLQHGFFDQVDSQISQIVSPEFRTAENIAQAAYEILVELDAKALPGVEVDGQGNVSLDWLLKRTCSKSPYKTHNKDFVDTSSEKYGDGTNTQL